MKQTWSGTNDSHFWLLKRLPVHSNLWPFKTVHVWGHGTWSTRHRNPTGVTIRFVVSGQWRIRQGKTVATAKPNEIFLALPGNAFELMQTEFDADWEWHEFQLSGPSAETAVIELGMSRAHPVAKPDHPTRALRLFKLLHAEMGKSNRSANKVLELLFRIIYACRSHGRRIPRKRHRSAEELVQHAANLLETDASPTMNVNQIAQRLGVDRTTLGRVFRKVTGDSPHKFIEQHRMLRAKELLQSTELPVYVISDAAGFADVKYFINWFRRKTNFSPGAWRKKNESEEKNRNSYSKQFLNP